MKVKVVRCVLNTTYVATTLTQDNVVEVFLRGSYDEHINESFIVFKNLPLKCNSHDLGLKSLRFQFIATRPTCSVMSTVVSCPQFFHGHSCVMSTVV